MQGFEKRVRNFPPALFLRSLHNYSCHFPCEQPHEKQGMFFRERLSENVHCTITIITQCRPVFSRFGHLGQVQRFLV